MLQNAHCRLSCTPHFISGGATPGRARSNDLAGRSTALAPSCLLLCFGNHIWLLYLFYFDSETGTREGLQSRWSQLAGDLRMRIPNSEATFRTSDLLYNSGKEFTRYVSEFYSAWKSRPIIWVSKKTRAKHTSCGLKKLGQSCCWFCWAKPKFLPGQLSPGASMDRLPCAQSRKRIHESC